MQTSHNNSEGISVVGKSSLRTCLMILILLNASSILLTTVTVNWWMYTILKEQLPTDLNLGSRTTISLFVVFTCVLLMVASMAEILLVYSFWTSTLFGTDAQETIRKAKKWIVILLLNSIVILLPPIIYWTKFLGTVLIGSFVLKVVSVLGTWLFIGKLGLDRVVNMQNTQIGICSEATLV
ncbi:uncharacterized protein LOC110860836 [Folsomia candida]|uniref:uncharacterized protein LOC110860836 n=1 Tax=Folsomia candida TaxID=158441 RepID=UPI001605049A|nr:uncharacterized protein LOC110860836 [Folsomia candida]